jgi:hypothetical protein
MCRFEIDFINFKVVDKKVAKRTVAGTPIDTAKNLHH